MPVVLLDLLIALFSLLLVKRAIYSVSCANLANDPLKKGGFIVQNYVPMCWKWIQIKQNFHIVYSGKTSFYILYKLQITHEQLFFWVIYSKHVSGNHGTLVYFLVNMFFLKYIILWYWQNFFLSLLRKLNLVGCKAIITKMSHSES